METGWCVYKMDLLKSEGVLIPEQVKIFIQDTSLLKKLCIILFVIMTSLRSIIQMNFYYARKWEKCKLQNEELRKWP